MTEPGAEGDGTERVESLGAGTTRYRLSSAAGPPTFAEMIAGLEESEAFREHLSELLAAAPFEAFFFEAPPITEATLERPFEFVLIDAPALARAEPEPEVFAEHYVDRGTGERRGTVTFPSLGGDALLVAPVSVADASWPHLAAFLRSAPDELQHELWRAVGEALRARLSDAPLWLSTSGLGVHWLHVRLDSRPKYYQHAAYRSAP